MQEDIKLKELLQQLAVEDTTAHFTQNIMQRIEADTAVKQGITPLIKQKPLMVLAGIFMLIVVILLVLCNIGQPVVFSFHSTLQLSPAYISQLITFLVVFWVVMLINQFYEQKSKPTG